MSGWKTQPGWDASPDPRRRDVGLPQSLHRQPLLESSDSYNHGCIGYLWPPLAMRKMVFQQGAGAELNSAQESFCNALKMPAQLLAWALAPLAATEPRQEADSLTTRRRRKRRRRKRRRRCGKGLGSETQGSHSPGSLRLSLSDLWGKGLVSTALQSPHAVPS